MGNTPAETFLGALSFQAMGGLGPFAACPSVLYCLWGMNSGTSAALEWSGTCTPEQNHLNISMCRSSGCTLMLVPAGQELSWQMLCL